MDENKEVIKEEDAVLATEQMSFVDDKYRFKLDNFEGPLDLLLHLIKGSKLDIMTVKLADITEQYLEYMQDLDSIDMDRASEFITVKRNRRYQQALSSARQGNGKG